MANLSIRGQLVLLVGVPVLGAALLGGWLAWSSSEQLRRSEALGSIERVAELTDRTATVLERVQRERAELARELGARSAESDGKRAVAVGTPLGGRAVRFGEELASASLGLERVLGNVDLARLPARLSRDLGEFRRQLGGLRQLRERVVSGTVAPLELLDGYGRVTAALEAMIAAASELTDDGELLRTIGALVNVLALGERASQQHAVLALVAEQRDFPPGTYRRLVSVVSEEETYVGVFRTQATADDFALLERSVPAASKELERLRAVALTTTDGEVQLAPAQWNSAAERKLAALAEVRRELTEKVRREAARKLGQTRWSFALSTGAPAFILATSVALALWVARRLLGAVAALQRGSAAVAAGDLDVHVDVRSHDELGELATAFNGMLADLKRARAALETQAKLARDLEVAADIQRKLVPPAPSLPGFEIAGRMVPADAVGGDFYDVLGNGEDHFWLTVGDVSGHGLDAGLVMLMAQAAFAACYRVDPDAPPAKVLRAVNGLLCENVGNRLGADKYVTGLMLAHDGGGAFRVAGAHVWPVIWRAATGTTELIPTDGPWLGIIEELEDVPEQRLQLAEGDVLCLYSDGLTESRDAAGELLDTDRFAALLADALRAGQPLEAAADAVIGGVRAYAAEQDDDWTLVLVRRR